MLDRLGVQCLLALAITTSVTAQPVRLHDVTVDDYFTIDYAEHPVLSPSGDAVVYSLRRWEPEHDRRNTDLWLVDVASQKRTRLTFDAAADTGAAWSGDGRWIYFRSARKGGDAPPTDGKAQVWRVSRDGGAPSAVTREADGVAAFALAGDDALYYTVSAKKPAQDEWSELRAQFKVEYGHGDYRPSILRRMDLETWRVETLVDEGQVIFSFAVSANGRRVAMVTAPDERLITFEGHSQVDVYHADRQVIERIDDRLWRDEAQSLYGWIIEPDFDSSGDLLAFRVDFDGFPGEVFVATFDNVRPTQVQQVTRPGEIHIEGDMRWLPGTNDLCVVAEDRARARVVRLTGLGHGNQSDAQTLTPGDAVVSGFSFSADGARMATIRSGLDHPPDVFVTPVADPSSLRRITTINPQVESWRIPQIRLVSWTAPDGTPVEGVLELPWSWRDGDAPIPMVVDLHGGPTASTKYEFRYWMYGHTLMAAQGWALFSPNYRGSTGYGDDFLIDLVEHENDIEVKDILAGVDAMVELGIADPERLAVSGWSNGGYLVNCLITQTDRFAAASSGAGVFDMTMQWALQDTPGHVINYMQGLPWMVPEHMRETSPLFAADKIKTPTVIHVGENDARVPAAHARALHRALRRYVGVPCELLVYPGEGHGLTTYTHRKAKLTWDLAWFRRYLDPSSQIEGHTSGRPRRGVRGYASAHTNDPNHNPAICPTCGFRPMER